MRLDQLALTLFLVLIGAAIGLFFPVYAISLTLALAIILFVMFKPVYAAALWFAVGIVIGLLIQLWPYAMAAMVR